MAVPADWAARRFSFDFAVDVYPAVLMRLRGTPVRLDELLLGQDVDAARRRPAPKKWSPLEHAGHLLDLESLWQTRLRERLEGVDVLTAADMTNAVTYAADYNSRSPESVCAAFRAAREDFLRKLDTLEPEQFGYTAIHPRLKMAMRLVDGLYFQAEHDDHHLAWIWELLDRN